MSAPRAFLKTSAMQSSGWSPAGQTVSFRAYYQTDLGADGLAIAQTLLGSCEADLTYISGWFGGIVPANIPFTVYVKPNLQGAMHYGCSDTEIYIGSFAGDLPNQSPAYSILLASEVVEVFEANVNLQWHCGYSNGECLSRVLATDLHPNDELPAFVTSAAWLDDTPAAGPYRANWVDQTDPEDTNKFSLGCGVLFLNWLRYSLSHPWKDIVAAGGDTLGRVYYELTGQNDGWQQFIAAIDARFPPGVVTNLTTDNPFR